MMRTEQISPPQSEGDSVPQADPSLIELAGYELKSLLGSGGYGEVWKAIGPGGFPKAVKVLYGRRDGDHAEAEMKALNRMRELRHPFLLNIERVEVCNNRLIVVTELADGNLNERFEACQSKGKMGVPRDELLGYLRDAADALDFMYEEHGLQHLDIKPDNLLLQGNHVKLGDFGLAKDVSISNVSMINGFTPLYASPELFEGRPGPASDQYSLAIVFQTMLTGKPPFNGRNAAQLTSQHLRSQPDLTSLAPADRPVIARALSKTASSRYSNCREMVDDLIHRNRASRHGVPQSPETPQSSETTSLSGDTTNIGIQEMTEAEPSTPASVPAVQEKPHCLRPALFIGVGGIGGNILRHLKATWAQSAGLNIPAWQVLAVDTDVNSLRPHEGLPKGAQLTDTEALPIRLRSSREYRKAQSLDMSWLSRRWLFNIPRSGLVEGMRPLGRLAVQDHLNALKLRIRSQIEAAIEADAVGQSAAATSVPFTADTIDVYIVAAVSGGTGSGAVGDIALIVREILEEFSNVKSTISGILVHGTGQTQRVDGIQNANAIACLKELRLLGMNGMGIPKGFDRAARDRTPFDNTWLFHCGDQLTGSDYVQTEQLTASFLYRATATPATGPWRASHESAGTSEEGEPTVRLLGMSTVDNEVYSMAEAEAASLASALLTRWQPSPAADEARTESPSPAINELLTSLKLTPETLPHRVLEELRGDAGRKIEQLAEAVYQRLCSHAGTESAQTLLQQEMARTDPGAGGAGLEDIRAGATRSLNADQQAGESRIRRLLRDPAFTNSVQERTAAISSLRSRIHETLDCCRQLNSEVDLAFQDLCSQASAITSDDRERLHEICRQYCALTGSTTIYKTFEMHIRNFMALLDRLTSELKSVQERIAQVAQHIIEASSVHSGIPAPLVDAFQTYLAGDDRTSLQALSTPGVDCESFANRLTDCATAFLLTAGAGSQNPNDAFPASAWPRLRGMGGQHRVMAWVPEGSDQSRWQSRLVNEFDDCVSVFPTRTGKVSVVSEVEGISGARLLKHFQTFEKAGWEMSERIHTRVDIQW